MSIKLNQISRAEKRDIALKIVDNLALRSANGPAEPALDAYMVECKDVADALGTHVVGNVTANAERAARLAQLDVADGAVDLWYRHIHSYIDVESRHRGGPHATKALALRRAAFPEGLAYIDEPIADENRACRDALAVLRSPEWADTLQAIEMPLQWLDRWEATITKSESLAAEVDKARGEKRAHVGAGRDAEGDWTELMVRLRRYVSSRAKRSEKAKIQEGKDLIAPLLDAVAKLRAEAAARATRKENKGKEELAQGTASPG